MNTQSMSKSEAIKRLGGTLKSAADSVGISVQAVSAWPDPLTDAIADRVIAAQVRELGILLPTTQSTEPPPVAQEAQ